MIYSLADMWLKPVPLFYMEGSVCSKVKFSQNLVYKAEPTHIHLFFLKDFLVLKKVTAFKTLYLSLWRLLI